ncbi:ScbR family autoregulator-binding transcription factor (plasmid) [Pseudarthrobacter sp. O4]|uniref:ScbR family autoregulator-binding transcription factor n=1 Tax=Pseudarthrobacter sp. O4 TaxID=3418417 RepID=UPI003CF02298
MTVQARAEKTRSAVLRAGAVVFNREGFARATAAAIIREAAVTKGSMQFHFQTKEKLAWAVIAEYEQEFGPASDAVSTQDGNSMTAAMELSAVIARQLTEEPFVGAAYRLTMEESTFASRVTKPYLDAVQMFEGLFRRAASAGELRPGINVEDLARYVVASFIGVQFVSDTLTSRTDLIERVAHMWLFLLPSIAEPRCLHQHLNSVRSIFVSHYTKSRSDLPVN